MEPHIYSINIKKRNENKIILCFYWTEFHINHTHVHSTINEQ